MVEVELEVFVFPPVFAEQYLVTLGVRPHAGCSDQDAGITQTGQPRPHSPSSQCRRSPVDSILNALNLDMPNLMAAVTGNRTNIKFIITLWWPKNIYLLHPYCLHIFKLLNILTKHPISDS